MTSTLDHIEKTLAEAYRKEIDQQENVWRSLPFFAATLALELGAVFQITARLPARGTGAWWDSIGCTIIAALSTLAALCFLAASIFMAKFLYLPPDPDLLDYAEGLDEEERQGIASVQDNPIDALITLKRTLSRQYAVAAHHNRLLNQRRAVWRSFAGLATLAAVLATLVLAAIASMHYAPNG